MKDHIYFKDGELTCSICHSNEAHNGSDFTRFKIHPIYNKDIVNPSDTNSDMGFWAECLTCKKATKPENSRTPYLYY